MINSLLDSKKHLQKKKASKQTKKRKAIYNKLNETEI